MFLTLSKHLHSKTKLIKGLEQPHIELWSPTDGMVGYPGIHSSLGSGCEWIHDDDEEFDDEYL